MYVCIFIVLPFFSESLFKQVSHCYLVSLRYFTVTLVVMLFIVIPNAEALKNNDVAINLSKTCVTMLQNNFTTACPTYEQINLLFPDESNQEVSGKFYYDEYGFWKRGNAQYSNHYDFYVYSGQITWLNPPGNLVGRVATITIEPSLDEYKLKTDLYDSKKMQNNTLYVGHSVWVDNRCYRATIGADDWILKTGQVMQYFYHDCDEQYKTFDNVKEKHFEKSYQDITTTYKWFLDHWIEDTKVRCKGLCFEY